MLQCSLNITALVVASYSYSVFLVVFIYFFIFVCAGSSLLCVGFL